MKKYIPYIINIPKFPQTQQVAYLNEEVKNEQQKQVSEKDFFISSPTETTVTSTPPSAPPPNGGDDDDGGPCGVSGSCVIL